MARVARRTMPLDLELCRLSRLCLLQIEWDPGRLGFLVSLKNIFDVDEVFAKYETKPPDETPA
jgi:hypothetical protein